MYLVNRLVLQCRLYYRSLHCRVIVKKPAICVKVKLTSHTDIAPHTSVISPAAMQQIQESNCLCLVMCGVHAYDIWSAQCYFTASVLLKLSFAIIFCLYLVIIRLWFSNLNARQCPTSASIAINHPHCLYIVATKMHMISYGRYFLHITCTR